MLATRTKLDSCAVKRSSIDQDDEVDQVKAHENMLHEEAEDYVCDISMMEISKSSTLQNHNGANVQVEEKRAMDMRYENEIHSNEIAANVNLHDNEIEIDRNDEEKTVTELVEANAINNGQLVAIQKNSQTRVAFGILLRLVLPLANGVARSIKGIRDARFLRVLNGIASSRQALTNLMAFAANTISMNLSSAQVSHRIEPILKLMKIRKSPQGLESLPDVQKSFTSTPSTPETPTFTNPTAIFSPSTHNPTGSTLPSFGTPTTPEPYAPKCCSLKVLAEPPPGEPIRADIIFIHGLHGSLVNTWRQGLWENDRRPVHFQRPPKPPVRPPKRARHSRSTCIRPPHKQKRARFGHLEDLYRQTVDHETTHDELEDNTRNDFSYVCGEPEDIKICDGIEYSFPAFRIRMNDDGRLLSAEIKTIINNGDNTHTNNCRESNEKKDSSKDTSKAKLKPKMTPNDPNYSKCWPGDWLPLDCPGVRVIAVNYTTDQYLWRPLWKKKEPRTNLAQRAREMAELLVEQKIGHGHPIIWVGHSKGGLFVKQIIVDAWESGRPAMAPFWRSARGCFFYSVPHRGSPLASIKAPLLSRSVELIDIEKNNQYLLDLHRRFAGLYYLGQLKVEVFSFVETALTLMSVLYLRIVGVDSADPGIGDVCGIRLDHREICKPRSRDCILYKELVKMIKKIY